MIIFLYGPDDYRRAQKKKDIIAEFGKKRSELGLGFFDLTEASALDGLDGFLRNQPIFENARLAVIENAFDVEAEKLANVLTPIVSEKSVQVLIAERDKPLKALSFLLEKPVLSQKFESLEGAELMQCIKSEARKRGVALGETAAQFLAAVYAGNTWALVTELEKISALTSSDSRVAQTIDKKDLDALDLEAAPNYWGLLNGMKSFDIRNRLYALEKLFSMNDPAPKLFNILAAQAGEKTSRMAEYDLAVKSGKLEYEEVLVDLVLG